MLNNSDQQAAFLLAMGNEKRLEILILVSEREWRVGDLATRLNLSQSALSQHLAKLRHDGLVSSRRDAQIIYYSTRHPGVIAMLDTLESIFRDKTIGSRAMA